MKPLVIFVAACLCASPTLAATLFVPQQYPTIQSAVNAANAGDTVKVAAGTYFEQVVLRDQVDVRGASAVIDATHVTSGFLAVDLAHGVTVSGFTIQNAGQDPSVGFAQGFRVINSNGVTVEDCTIVNSVVHGVRGIGATNLSLRRLSIHDNGAQGVRVNSGSVTLQDSDVFNSGAAGARFDGSFVRVMRTRFTNNHGGSALRCHAGSVCHVEENTFTNNDNSLTATDSDDTLNGGLPSVLYSRGNRIEGSRGTGIVVWNSTLFSLDDTLTHNQGGIIILNGSRVEFVGLRESDTIVSNGLDAVSSNTYCVTPDCTSFLLQNTPIEVKLVGARITGSYYSGVRAAAGARITMIDTVITGNGTSGSGDGLSAQSVDVQSVNGPNDTTVSIPSLITVRHSTISGNNGFGATAIDDSRLDLGVQPVPGTDGKSGNDEERSSGRNTISANRDGSVRNFTANSVPAQGNWWGTTDPAAIQAGIRDCATNNTEGCVIFSPFLASQPESK